MDQLVSTMALDHHHHRESSDYFAIVEAVFQEEARVFVLDNSVEVAIVVAVVVDVQNHEPKKTK